LITFGTLALIVAVGLLGPLLALLPFRFAPPLVIGEITAGVIFGRTGTQTIVPDQPTLAFLAAIGFALLMFIVGTRLPMREVRLRKALRKGFIAAALTAAIAVAVAPLIAWATGLHHIGVIAVLIAASSAAVVLPITSTITDPSDDLLLTVAWVSIADVATIVAVPFVLTRANVGKVAIGSVIVVLAAVLIGVVGRRAATWPAVETLRHASHHLDWAIDLRVSLLVLFTLAWIAERFDTSVLIAGFAAGLMVSALGEPRRVADQLIGLGEGFFVPLFFVVLGAGIDLRALARSREDLGLLALLAAASIAVPVLVAVIMRIPAPFGLLASAELGVPAAVSAIGLSTGMLRPGQAAAIVGAAAISLAAAAVGAALIGATSTGAPLTPPLRVRLPRRSRKRPPA